VETELSNPDEDWGWISRCKVSSTVDRRAIVWDNAWQALKLSTRATTQLMGAEAPLMRVVRPETKIARLLLRTARPLTETLSLQVKQSVDCVDHLEKDEPEVEEPRW